MIRVIIRNTVTGQEWDLTRNVGGLQWSSSLPGGDETASFTLKRAWYSGAPEISMGNQVRIVDGLDELFRGRIEENDRAVEESERIGVVAHGSGIVLRDSTFQEIYVDSDVSHWTGPSVQLKLTWVASFPISDCSVSPDATTGAPSLITEATGPWASSALPWVIGMYDAGTGVTIGSIYYAWKKSSTISTSDNFDWAVRASTDDIQTSTNATGNLEAAGPGTGTLSTTGSNKRFGFAQVYYSSGASTTDNTPYAIYWTCLAVYGEHGLTKRGVSSATAPQGFYVSDIVRNIVGKCSGVAARRIDGTSFVLTQCEFRDPIVHEDAVKNVNQYHGYDYGTHPPSSALDLTDNGQFDFKAPDTGTVQWSVRRAKCDDITLDTDFGAVFNRVQTRYQDAVGGAQLSTRTQAVKELDERGITRTKTLDGGTLSSGAADLLGDTFLRLSGGAPPARGSVRLSGPVNHYVRGRMPAHHMRADGSNLAIEDIELGRDQLTLNTNAQTFAFDGFDRSGTIGGSFADSGQLWSLYTGTDWTITSGVPACAANTSQVVLDIGTLLGRRDIDGYVQTDVMISSVPATNDFYFRMTFAGSEVQWWPRTVAGNSLLLVPSTSVTSAPAAAATWYTLTLIKAGNTAIVKMGLRGSAQTEYINTVQSSTFAATCIVELFQNKGITVSIDNFQAGLLLPAFDRKNVFPIRRVSVDCSGKSPVTTVDVDQESDRFAVLQSRLALAADLAL